ncbi:biotin--[acetyl-CoA-carboxylase] ligase [Croceivirga thetidis]|uniref:Biotin--[acetyl-CoA-carboxylase] ligase n=1 Tax=Croceivirga thetidis TaxID=2721623 RepID=A0ABX1GUT2_9FLAO|nr:biotin--[acetyl-CoA-carboxylase] ligase [Croceivirga thetidis]NKI33374.1 biotin--[acetyl-CoA-carboxylase] ligase [Croceivirga thetidis]
MNIIKLDATASTNLFLKELAGTNDLPDFTVVSCYDQTNGRGQRGSHWVTEPGKNLTFSVLKHHSGLQPINQFKINIAVSLAIYHVLAQNGLQKIFVKWPNDIMADDKKICGILIENILNGSRISKSVIGVGLNINQKVFEGLENATSMSLQDGREFDLEQILAQIITQLQIQFETLLANDLYEQYLSVLYRFNLPSSFIDQEGNEFLGKITGIEIDGKLRIKTESDGIRQFNFKEVKMTF